MRTGIIDSEPVFLASHPLSALFVAAALVLLTAPPAAAEPEPAPATAAPTLLCCRSVHAGKGGVVGKGCKSAATAADSTAAATATCHADKRVPLVCDTEPQCDARGQCACPRREARGRSAAATSPVAPARTRPLPCRDGHCPDGFFCVVVDAGKPKVCLPGVDTALTFEDLDDAERQRPDGELLDSVRVRTLPKSAPPPGKSRPPDGHVWP